MPERRGWYTPRRLPHLDGEIIQSVTFRTADSIAEAEYLRILELTQTLPDDGRRRERLNKIETNLDRHCGDCLLGDEPFASIVCNALLFHDTVRYRLHAWVVMPNHVHILFQPLPSHSLASIIKSWKGVAARAINSRLGKRGSFWHKDYFDRGIRDQAHFESVFEYIENNPVKARLCKRSEGWAYGSAGANKGRRPIIDN